MANSVTHRALVAPNVWLDGRLAIFHDLEGWLAVADLHFGYEISQRFAGRLVPLWGMKSIEERLLVLFKEYRPRRLIIAGDLVHDARGKKVATDLLERLRAHCEVIALIGNHDRRLRGAIEFSTRFETPDFVFHHGDTAPEATDRIQIIGHHHPAVSVGDGAGLRLKLPALIQQERRWILPAFSPWAGGVIWPNDDQSEIWLCAPQRVLRVVRNSAAA